MLKDSTTKENLADAMALDFEHDLHQDGLTPEAISAQVARSKARITSAPVAILLCMDLTDMDHYPDQKRSHAERTMAVQSVAAAGLQLLLASHAEGLGAVWACWVLFAQETIQKTLSLPSHWEPQAMFFVGYAEKTPEARERKALNEIVLYI